MDDLLDGLEREELQRKLDDAIAEAEDCYGAVKVLQRQLSAYWNSRRALHNAIAKTHVWVSGAEARAHDRRVDFRAEYVVRMWRPGVRAELFKQRDALGREWGPVLESLRVAKIEEGIAKREVEAVRAEMKARDRALARGLWGQAA